MIYRVVFVSTFLLNFLMVSNSPAAVKEHPIIRPYPGAVCMQDDAEYKDYAEYEFRCYDKTKDEQIMRVVKGRYWQLYYEIRDAAGKRNGTVSVADIMQNYKAAALEMSGTVEYEDANNGFLTFTLPRENGAKTWCYLEASDGYYGIWIIDEKGFEKKLAFTAAELKDALDKSGHVAVYGILFDVNKVNLKPESIAPLREMVVLLIQNPQLKLEVQGHTDDQGSDEYNLKLSEDRVRTVVQYLSLFGVAPDRLTAKGYGETKPVAPNDTEEGRAKNRRVELVKL